MVNDRIRELDAVGTGALANQRLRIPLTTLYLRRAVQSGTGLGLIMLDVDNIERFKEQFGCAAGDAILRELGVLLQSEFRGEDVVCRHGGEGILIILPDSSAEETERAAERLLVRVRLMPFEHDGRSLGPIMLSLGVVFLFPDRGSGAKALLQKACAALSVAQAADKDRGAVGQM